MFEKFTERARKVMSYSRQEAQRLHQEFIGTEHILLGIIQEGGGVAAKVLKNLNINFKDVVVETEKLVKVPETAPLTLGQLPFSPRAKRVIELAGEAASQLNHEVIGTEHLLLGLLKEDEGIAAQVLINLGLKLDAVRDMIFEVLGDDVDPQPAGTPAPTPPAEKNVFFKTLRDMLEEDRLNIEKVAKDQQSNFDKLHALYKEAQEARPAASALSSEDKAKMIVDAWLARGGQTYPPNHTDYLTNMIAFTIEASRRGA